MRWRQRTASDDQGHSAEQPRREETVWVAADAAGCQWTVALHDDGKTWNLTCTTAGEFVEGLVGFKSADAAMAKGDECAADLT